MNTTSLKFPAGDFTHAELAEFNGVSKPEIWTQYQDAIKTGVIVSAGSRKTSTGRGRPSLLWTLAKPNQTVSVVVTPVREVAVAPAIPAVSEVPTIDHEPIPVPPETESDVVLMSSNCMTDLVVDEARITIYDCPVCQNKLITKKDTTGVSVWCGQPKSVCNVSEAPFGHGRNEATAFSALTEKWNFALGKK
jgi:hypothetical protein